MIIAIDIETYEFNQSTGYYEPVLDARKFVLGCAKTDTGTTKFFTNHEDMWQWLHDKIETNARNRKRTFIYEHNTEYDWYGIAQQHLMPKDLKYIIFGMPMIAIWKQKGYILDTMAFYRMSLEKVGDLLNFPKLEMPKQVKDPMELKDYLERDVEITLQAMLRLRDQLKKLGFNMRKFLTAGQVSMTAFWTFCKRNGTLQVFTWYNEETHMRSIYKTKFAEDIRQAFRGGDNRAWQIGKFQDVEQWDANGMYAAMMRKMRFPMLSTERKDYNIAIEKCKQHFERIGVAQCTIKVPSISHPFLPVRFGGYTVFPSNCIVKGTWTHQELTKALELGYEILTCHWSISYNESSVNPFTEFIDHLYKIEKDCKTPEERAPLKLIRNNLYGKFAQYKRGREYDIVYRYEVEDKLFNGWTIDSTVGAKYVISKEGSKYDPYYTNPIISTLITADARMFLWEHLSKIPIGDLLYNDTDSIMYKGDYAHVFTEGIELGEWKKEAAGDAKILGEKRYYVADKVKISGLPKRDMTKDAIEREEDIQTQRMFGLQQGIKTGQFEKVGGFTPHTIEMQPHCKLQLVLPNTIDETGIEMGDW